MSKRYLIIPIVFGALIFLGAGCAKEVAVDPNQEAASWKEQAAAILSYKDKVQDLQEKLLEAKVKFGLLDSSEVREVLTGSEKNKFYFIIPQVKNSNVGERIEVYDATNDRQYKEFGEPAIDKNVSILYQEALPDGGQFRLVGFDGKKLVFEQTGIEDSPGPCYSMWLSSGLKYIDLDAAKPVKRDYSISVEKKRAVEAEVKQCEDNFVY